MRLDYSCSDRLAVSEASGLRNVIEIQKRYRYSRTETLDHPAYVYSSTGVPIVGIEAWQAEVSGGADIHKSSSDKRCRRNKASVEDQIVATHFQ